MKPKYYKILFVILLVFACKEQSANSEAGGQDELDSGPESIFVSHDQFDNSGMQLGKINKQSFPETVQVAGIVDVPPQYKAQVTAKMGGFIKETNLLEGDRVRKGQFLVSIENPEFVDLQQSYLEVKERLEYLKSEYERQKTLFEEKIISEKSYLKAESDFKSAQARMNGQRKQLQLLNIPISNVESGKFTSVARIYAPIQGNISSINVSMGSPVSPETIILEIIDNAHLHIEMSVYEKDVLKIKKGQLIKFKIPESGDIYHEGEVYLVGTTIESNRTITVHGHPRDETLTLLPGMYISAEIVTDSVDKSALAESAIVELDDQAYILRLLNRNDSGYEFEKVAVTVEHHSDNYISFTEASDYKDEDQFLVKGTYDLIGE